MRLPTLPLSLSRFILIHRLISELYFQHGPTARCTLMRPPLAGPFSAIEKREREMRSPFLALGIPSAQFSLVEEPTTSQEFSREDFEKFPVGHLFQDSI